MLTPKQIAFIIEEKFFQEREIQCDWFVVGTSVSENEDQHFVLLSEKANCYCRVTVNFKNEIIYLKFFC